jgi:hypothetical protein
MMENCNWKENGQIQRGICHLLRILQSKIKQFEEIKQKIKLDYCNIHLQQKWNHQFLRRQSPPAYKNDFGPNLYIGEIFW